MLTDDINVVAFGLRTAKTQVERWRGQAELLDRQAEETQRAHAALTHDAEIHKEALVILQSLEKKWRGAFEQALATVVSEGLSAVFGRPITISIESKLARGVASVNITMTDGDVTTSILGAEGGSVVNVVSFLLRVLLTISVRPPLRRLLVLDEPFSHVSTEYRPALCQLLREMAQRLEIQIVLVSHEEELADAAIVTYLVEKPGDEAEVKRLTGPNESLQIEEDAS